MAAGRRRLFIPPALLFAAYGLAYGSVLFSTYAHSDDYSLPFWISHVGIHPWKNSIFAEGRPLYSLTLQVFFKNLFTIGEYRWARLLSLLGILAAGMILQRLYARAGWRSAGSTAAALVLTLTPSFGIMAGYAVLFPFPFAASAALAGGALSHHALADWKGGRRLAGLIAAGLLTLLALTIYQPCAAFAVVAMMILSTGPKRGLKEVRAWLGGSILYAVVLILYLVLYKLAVHRWYLDFSIASRGEITTDIYHNIQYIISNPLKYCLTSWGIFYDPWIQILTAMIIALGALAGLGRMIRSGRSYSRLFPVLAAVTVIFCLAPFLVVREGYAPFRALAPLYGAVLHLFLLGLGGPGRAGDLSVRRIRRGMRALPATAILPLLLLTGHHVREEVIRPQAEEVAALRDHLSKSLHTYPRSLTFILPAYRDLRSAGGSTPMHEYGLPSSWLPWVPRGMITMLLNEQFGRTLLNTPRERLADLKVLPVRREGYREILPLPVVDGSSVLLREALPAGMGDLSTRATDPYQELSALYGNLCPPRKEAEPAAAQSGSLPGPLEQGAADLGDGWRYLPWFGYFNIDHAPWIYHRGLGWIFLEENLPGTMRLYSKGLGWLETGCLDYPYLRVVSAEERWLWYAEGSTTPRLFYDMRSLSWMEQ